MEHGDDAGEAGEALRGDVEPLVESVDEEGADIFSRVAGEVRVWFEQGRVVDRCGGGRGG